MAVNGGAALTYATPATDARVLYTREGARATVVIHRPERRAKAAAAAVGNFVGEALIILLALPAVVAYQWSAWVALSLVPGIMAAVYVLAWLLSWRLARPIVIELADGRLTASNLDGPRKRESIDMAGVYAIKFVRHSGNIVVRRHGRDIFELSVTPDAADTQRIADFLRDAAGLGPEAPEVAVAKVNA